MKPRGELIDALLAEVGTHDAWQARATEHPCEGAKFHSPAPLTTAKHDELDAWLCPTCMSKLDIFMHLHRVNPVLLSWDVMREFGNQIRLMGQRIIRDREASES